MQTNTKYMTFDADMSQWIQSLRISDIKMYCNHHEMI